MIATSTHHQRQCWQDLSLLAHEPPKTAFTTWVRTGPRPCEHSSMVQGRLQTPERDRRTDRFHPQRSYALRTEDDDSDQFAYPKAGGSRHVIEPKFSTPMYQSMAPITSGQATALRMAAPSFMLPPGSGPVIGRCSVGASISVLLANCHGEGPAKSLPNALPFVGMNSAPTRALAS